MKRALASVPLPALLLGGSAGETPSDELAARGTV